MPWRGHYSPVDGVRAWRNTFTALLLRAPGAIYPMLYYLYEVGLTHPEHLSFLRLFWYVTFRAGLAAFMAFMIVVLLGKPMIRLLRRMQTIAPPRHEGSSGDGATQKRQVPSMGGLLIVLAVVVSVLMCAIPTQRLVQIFVWLIIGMCGIGFLDDYMKIKKKQKASEGLSGKAKLGLQVLVAVVGVWLLDQAPESAGYVRTLMVPFFKEPLFSNLPIWVAVAFGVLVVVGSSNAVNLTDGMDGLATGCTVISALAYAAFAYACGTSTIAEHLLIPYLPGSTEVAVIACAMAGAALGFLWHNCPPAGMFMGDTGSLALGGAIGLIAVLVKQELLLVIIGGVFVIEAGSVILQVSYFKLTRRLTGKPKRLFICAPYHHHLEGKGWKDTQVVIRFWVVAVVLAGIGLATLKIR